MSARSACAHGPPGVHSQHSMRARSGPIPAARRASASSGVAVPSQLAPASSAARAHGSAPWP